MKIEILPEETIEKIAAGEVVERPVSVVKELLENSLDAGATRVEVRFSGGGINLIEVSDNGRGMSPRELNTAVRRHATSKIKRFEDLEKISTLGFRGEALPSIAAVSRLSITSRVPGSDEGARLLMEGPGKPALEPAARADGTTVKVQELFFNVPARRKFLKSEKTERRHIISCLEDFAVIRPDVSFKVVSGDRTVLDFTPSTFRERFLAVAGKKLCGSLLEAGFENPYIRVKGFLTAPQKTFASKNKMRFYVNSRAVHSPLILHSVMEAYRDFIPRGRYPAAAIDIGIDPKLVDVNVHPAKREVKFVDNQGVHQILAKVIRNLLEGSPPSFEFEFGREKPERGGDKSGGRRGYPGSGGVKRRGTPAAQENFPSADLSEPTKFTFRGPEKPSPPPRSAGKDSGIIPRFQYRKRYVVGEDRDGIVIIDQHTAWERINYERLKRQFAEKKINRQGSLMPAVIEPGPGRAELLLENIELLNSFGVEVEEFGPGIFRVRALPDTVSESAGEEIVDDILDILQEKGKAPSREELADDIIKSIACRSSVMSGDRVSAEEMNLMVRMLEKCSVPHRCPHGRPVIMKVSRKEIDSEFGR